MVFLLGRWNVPEPESGNGCITLNLLHFTNGKFGYVYVITIIIIIINGETGLKKKKAEKIHCCQHLHFKTY